MVCRLNRSASGSDAPWTRYENSGPGRLSRSKPSYHETIHRMVENEDDFFTARLMAYDDALATGGETANEPAGDTGDDDRLDRAKSFLDQLEELWPRRKRVPLDAGGWSGTFANEAP